MADQEPQQQKSSGFDQLVLYRMTSMEDAVRQLADQVSKLVVIEERQTQTAAAVDRAFGEIKNESAERKALDLRVKSLELSQPISNRTNVWVERLVLAAAGAAVPSGALLVNKLLGGG